MENRILVAAPTFNGMKYCQDKSLFRIKELDYGNYDILIVDNSKDKNYYDELKK